MVHYPVHPRCDASMVPISSPLRRVWDPGGMFIWCRVRLPTAEAKATTACRRDAFVVVPSRGTTVYLFQAPRNMTRLTVAYVHVHATPSTTNRSFTASLPLIAFTRAQRVWDPGTRRSVSVFNYCHPVLSRPMALNPALPIIAPLRRVWDPGDVGQSACRDGVDPVLSMVRFDLSNESKFREVLIQSLFQYSHPILSRPTVPNIQ